MQGEGRSNLMLQREQPEVVGPGKYSPRKVRLKLMQKMRRGMEAQMFARTVVL